MHVEHSIKVARRDKTRGFTLIELLVASIAALLVAAAAISFSKQSTRAFSQESRIAAAQMSVLAGFQRLQGDVARAAYMGTPNIQYEVSVGRACLPPTAVWSAAELNSLTGLFIGVEGSTTAPVNPWDGKKPDSIRIAGSLSSTEFFPIRTIQPVGSGHDVYLQVNTGAMTRSGFVVGSDLTSVFAPGRILRILTDDGKQIYEAISSASWSGTSAIVKTAHALPDKGQGDACGIAGHMIGAQASVVDLVEYSIANVSSHPVYSKTVYSDAGYAYGDEHRTELIRREIRLSGDPPPSEIVAEYAVDLRAGIWVANAGGSLSFVPAGSAAITSTWMQLDSTTSGPQSIRSVELRLVVRSREVDLRLPADEGLDAGDEGGAPNAGAWFRYPLPDNAGYARARTLIADVTLHNQGGDSW